MKSIHLLITGKVQGVGYRAWLEQEARARAVTGWVRNRRDGKVEAALRGADAIVDELVVACRRGPPAAAVRLVEITQHAGPVSDSFVVLPTR